MSDVFLHQAGAVNGRFCFRRLAAQLSELWPISQAGVCPANSCLFRPITCLLTFVPKSCVTQTMTREKSKVLISHQKLSLLNKSKALCVKVIFKGQSCQGGMRNIVFLI